MNYITRILESKAQYKSHKDWWGKKSYIGAFNLKVPLSSSVYRCNYVIVSITTPDGSLGGLYSGDHMGYCTYTPGKMVTTGPEKDIGSLVRVWKRLGLPLIRCASELDHNPQK